MKLTRNLRARLMAVALIALVPLLGFFFYSWRQVSELVLRGEHQEMMHYAEMAAASHRDLLTGYRSVLAVLAELPREQHFDPDFCTSLFTGLITEPEEYSTLASVEPDGEIRCRVPAAEEESASEGSTSLADREYIKRAVQTGLPTTADYRLRAGSGRGSIAMAHPVVGEDGVVHTVLAAGLDLRALGASFAASRLPEGGTLTIIDRDGVVLLRAPEDQEERALTAPLLLAAVADHPVWARPGDPAPASRAGHDFAEGEHLHADAYHYPSGHSYANEPHISPRELVDLDGVSRVFAFAPLDVEGLESGVMVAVGFDPQRSAASLGQVLRTNLLGLAFAGALLLLGVWGSFELAFLRRLSPVIDAAAKLGGGDLGARTGLVYGRDELGELARTFDEMATNVQSLREKEVRQAEGEIREREERFAQIASSINEVFWLLDSVNERVLYASPAFESIWGRPMEEAYGDREAWLCTIHPEDRDRLAPLSSRSHLPEECEYRIVRPDATIRWLRERSFPLLDGDGEPYRLVCVSEDITDRKKLEDQLRQSHKMEAVGQLAGGVAHDFNNILTAIQGHIQLLLGEVAPGDALSGDLAEIGRAADRAATLTRQLLAFSRKQMLQPSILAPADVVSRMEELLRRLIGSHVKLVTATKGRPGAIRADETQIEQVLLNLCVNARDAMPDGGTLTIETATVRTDASSHTMERMEAGEYVRLSVSDTGAGIPRELHERIFEPFFTTKGSGRGTGLGLATVYGIVKQSGGFISLRSGPDGTTFDLYFPRVEADEIAHRAVDPELPSDGGSETVLLAEDDDAVRGVTLRILRKAGYGVLEAANGEEAVAIASSFPDRIDLLLSDVVMPGLRGPALAARLAPVRPEMKVLFMSGYVDPATAEGLPIPAGCTLLPKPFTTHALLQEVRRALEGPALAGASGAGADG